MTLPQLWQRIKRTFGFGVQTRNAFAGSVVNRLNDFVFATNQTANQELRGELVPLRNRSGELARNDPNARRFLAMLAQNVVGHRGIRLEVQSTLKTGKNAGELDDDVNDAIEDAWADWGRPGTCDVTRKLSWTEFQKKALRGVARDGEAFIRIIEGFKNDYGFALQLLDPSMIDETYNVLPGNGQNRVDMGVETDEWGAPVKYWMWTKPPQEIGGTRERKPIPAREMIHLFVEERAGQARGIPWFAPVMLAMRHLHGYTEAELVAARTAAAKMGFIEQGEDAEGPDPDQPVGQNPTMDATPGVIDRLGKGEHFTSWDPQHPAGNFGPFTLTVLRNISSGLNVSYMGLTGDLTSANYSSARVGLLDERDGWRSLQTWLAEHLHDRVYRRWLRIASLTPKLRLPSADFSKYEVVCWRPRGWAWVDPKNDIESAALAVDRGFQSPIDIVADNGDELDDIYQGIAKAKKLAAQYGIELSTGVNPRPAVDKVGGETPQGTPAATAVTAPPGDSAAAKEFVAALTRIAESTRETSAAVKWIAGREQPAPIINVTTPDVVVDARSTHEAPVVNITQPDIRVEAPVVNVTTPDVRIEGPTINLPDVIVSELKVPEIVLPEIRIPDVIVPPIVIPDVIVQFPATKRKLVEHEKDARGVFTGRSTVTEIEDAPAPPKKSPRKREP